MNSNERLAPAPAPAPDALATPAAENTAPTPAATSLAPEAAYIDSLSDLDWRELSVQLRRFARYLKVPTRLVEDLVQQTCLLERDPRTRKWNRTKCPDFIAHLRRRFVNERWKNQVKKANNTLPLPEDPDDPVYESEDAVGASPERKVVNLDLLREAAEKLRRQAEKDPVERGVLRLRAQGIMDPSDQAHELRVAVAEVTRATSRLATKASAIARELGFVDVSDMLAGAAPEVEAKKPLDDVPESTGGGWAWAFVATGLSGLALAGLAVWLGASRALEVRDAGVVVAWVALYTFVASCASFALWLVASWRSLPSSLRYNDRGDFVGDLGTAMRRLLVPGLNLYVVYVLTGDLAEALSRTLRRGKRDERVSRRLARVAFLATFVAPPVAPILWVAWVLQAERAKRALLAVRREGRPLHFSTPGADPSSFRSPEETLDAIDWIAAVDLADWTAPTAHGE